MPTQQKSSASVARQARRAPAIQVLTRRESPRSWLIVSSVWIFLNVCALLTLFTRVSLGNGLVAVLVGIVFGIAAVGLWILIAPRIGLRALWLGFQYRFVSLMIKDLPIFVFEIGVWFFGIPLLLFAIPYFFQSLQTIGLYQVGGICYGEGRRLWECREAIYASYGPLFFCCGLNLLLLLPLMFVHIRQLAGIGYYLFYDPKSEKQRPFPWIFIGIDRKNLTAEEAQRSMVSRAFWFVLLSILLPIFLATAFSLAGLALSSGYVDADLVNPNSSFGTNFWRLITGR